ncbi:DUF6344 domain-containing protein [Streptomyces europaeiscabiei]|uniref:DUF6344 domain-containing protein n=1 Tax=Streptomyces europaeiscabiei TaxID=146819 RepID=UPI000765CB91|nr:DUF6344 domain-containing protein [Streptomyces europaeiscabiei]MDX3672501.1 DUF6344 domain-containing protein [Streptomyces europaeiscabiei]MDX3712501.1 DUF6344 domain-containing protein [Streptomyces europaeiscabiei]
MAQNKVMKLWTAVVTAVLALCTALGLITTTASAAVPQTKSTRNCAAPTTTSAAMTPPARPHDRALPPTMKQRIRAEAHGSSPSCRHRTPLDTAAMDGAALEPPLPQVEQPAAPLQR